MSSYKNKLYQVVFFVPKEHCEPVKQALFSAGAGAFNNYEQCCWQTSGEGQFCPVEGSSPFIGKTGELEIVDEFRIEMFCRGEYLKDALDALVKAHPYEEPAYYATKILTLDSLKSQADPGAL